MKNLRKGFTLVELLVVIAVIGILFVVLISKVDFATDKAKETGVKTDFRSYQLSMEQVAREQTGFVMGSPVVAGDETAIINELNKNLDKKLRITDTAASTGDSTIAAKDAWGTVYHISFDPSAVLGFGADKVKGGADDTTGAAVTLTSYGPNKAAGVDDITITTGYGASGVVSFTTGLSNNLDTRM